MSGQPEEEQRAEALRWLDEAKADLASATFQASAKDLPGRIACFLAHLAAEKALKALLISVGFPFARTHDLVALHENLPEAMRARFDPDALASLNPWAIAGRYTADLADADHETATTLIGRAASVVTEAGTLLGRSPDTR